MSIFFIGTTIGGLIISGAFDAIEHWRFVSVYFLLIPSVLLFLITYFLLEDTP